MKIAIIYNRDSKAVINLFGTLNREVYGFMAIEMIREALIAGGHQVKAFEGDKNIVHNLEEFMPAVISGERPGLVLNLSYGIQGRARYAHIPAILEMLGIPYVGSGPETQAVALDKVLTKIILIQKGLPTPPFTVLENPDFDYPLAEKLQFPLIVKPKSEAASFGLQIVNSEKELRTAAAGIFKDFKSAALVEKFVDGREVNIGIMGNEPVETLPAVELFFDEGIPIYTYEDKMREAKRRIKKVCPANLPCDLKKELHDLAIASFKALGCLDSARVDFRIDSEGKPQILEVNSMASLNPDGSFAFAAEKIGLSYSDLVNRLVDIASIRYFGPHAPGTEVVEPGTGAQDSVFAYLTQNRDLVEDNLKKWTNLVSRTGDPVALGAAVNMLTEQMAALNMRPVKALTNRHFAWTWQSASGLSKGTLLVCPLDVPAESSGKYPIPFRRDPEKLYGEGIATSRAGLTCITQALKALHRINLLKDIPVALFAYSDEGRGMAYSSHTLQIAARRAARVLVFQPGGENGAVIDQRLGSRKYSILLESLSESGETAGSFPDLMSLYLKLANTLQELNQLEPGLNLAIQDINSQRYSNLPPHRVQSTFHMAYLESDQADRIEMSLQNRCKKTSAKSGSLRCLVEKLEERPPLEKTGHSAGMVKNLNTISERWQLPFEVCSGPSPSAAGVVPSGVPVLCGLAPSGKNIYTPFESISRGELLQRTLLLAMLLMEKDLNWQRNVERRG